MAGSPLAAAGQRCHVRSISSPSRSHPTQLRVEEELQKIRTSIDITSAAPEMMQGALRELTDLYESFEKLIHLPSNQTTCTASSEKKWLEVELNESVKLLDLCCTLKDSLIMKNENIKDLQLALRRRDNTAMRGKATAFLHAMKKTDKDIKNRFRLLKYVDNKSMDNNHLEAVAKFLVEVRSITISLLELVSSFFSTQSGRQTSSRWSLVTKALSKRKVSSDGESGMSGFEILDLFSYFDSILHIKDVDEQRLQKFQIQLQSMEVFMEGLETGLESLFRQMIHIRVTLLNSLSS